MIYVANITTPKNTQLAALKKTTISVTKGLVYKVEFYFPAGSRGLMGVAVFDGLYQIWPSTAGQFFAGDDITISFDDMYLKESAPFELTCYTYNEDDTNEHFLAVRVGFVSAEVFLARFMPGRNRQQFAVMRKKMETERLEREDKQRAERRSTVFEWMDEAEVITE